MQSISIKKYRLLFVAFMLSACLCHAQTKPSPPTTLQMPTINKYISQVNNKIDKYQHRLTGKTEKTLTKLAKWENKIRGLLKKASPETAQRLFGDGKTTFNTLLQQLKKGEQIVNTQRAKYDAYRDKLTTSLKYLQEQKQNINAKLIQPIQNANKKLGELEEDTKRQEAIEAFIKERKKQLIDEAVKYIGNSKYLTKINKESYYYIETIKNYKELFSDKKKAEELAYKILNKIPAFKNFVQQNSMLASLFRMPGSGSNMNPVSLAGLQTRVSVQAQIQERIGAGGPNAREQFNQNLQRGQSELNKLKDKISNAGGSSSDANIPDFKPNTQKTKTFFQRLEYGSNFQFAKSNSYLPTTADIALSVGYKLNDKSIVGIGASYKMGLGSIQRLSVSHQGIGIRSFIDWKLKKQFFVTGGFEMNYNAQFKNLELLKQYDDWQQSGLVGITKKINVKTKWFNGTKAQLLYDMLYRTHIPVSQPIIFRINYNF